MSRTKNEKAEDREEAANAEAKPGCEEKGCSRDLRQEKAKTGIRKGDIVFFRKTMHEVVVGLVYDTDSRKNTCDFVYFSRGTEGKNAIVRGAKHGLRVGEVWHDLDEIEAAVKISGSGISSAVAV